MSSQHKNAFRGEHITAVYTGVFKACKATRNNIWSVTIEKPIVKFHYFDCEFNLRFFCFVLFCDCIKLFAFAVTNAEFRMKRARAVSGAPHLI